MACLEEVFPFKGAILGVCWLIQSIHFCQHWGEDGLCWSTRLHLSFLLGLFVLVLDLGSECNKLGSIEVDLVMLGSSQKVVSVVAKLDAKGI